MQITAKLVQLQIRVPQAVVATSNGPLGQGMQMKLHPMSFGWAHRHAHCGGLGFRCCQLGQVGDDNKPHLSTQEGSYKHCMAWHRNSLMLLQGLPSDLELAGKPLIEHWFGNRLAFCCIAWELLRVYIRSYMGTQLKQELRTATPHPPCIVSAWVRQYPRTPEGTYSK